MNTMLLKQEAGRKGESVEERFAGNLNRVLSELFDLCLDQNRAKRVREKREANERYNLKYQELEGLIREVMRSPGTAIKVYEKLGRLFTQVLKHRASVQYLVLNGVVEKIDLISMRRWAYEKRN